MNDKTKEWFKVIASMIIFNLFILGIIAYNNLINLSTLSLKIILDVIILFTTDKTIKKLSVGWKDGFNMERG